MVQRSGRSGWGPVPEKSGRGPGGVGPEPRKSGGPEGWCRGWVRAIGRLPLSRGGPGGGRSGLGGAVQKVTKILKCGPKLAKIQEVHRPGLATFSWSNFFWPYFVWPNFVLATLGLAKVGHGPNKPGTVTPSLPLGPIVLLTGSTVHEWPRNRPRTTSCVFSLPRQVLLELRPRPRPGPQPKPMLEPRAGPRPKANFTFAVLFVLRPLWLAAELASLQL